MQFIQAAYGKKIVKFIYGHTAYPFCDTETLGMVDFGAAVSVHIIRIDYTRPIIQIHSNLNRLFRSHDRNLRRKGNSLPFVYLVVSDSELSID